MEPFSPIWFVGGIILGFVVEYLIDLLFWRRRIDRVAATNATLTEARAREQKELLHLRERVDSLDTALRDKEEALQEQDADLQAISLQRDDMAVQREASMARVTQLEEDLDKLNERFDQCQEMLTQMRQQLRALEQTEDGQLQIAYQQTLTELEGLRSHSSTIEAELEAARSGSHQLQQELTAIQAEAADYGAAIERLQAANQDKETLLARLERDEAALREMLAERDRALAAQQAAAKLAPSADRLQRIRGIGDVYAERLNAAGVVRFAQLVELDEQQIREIINPENWQELKVAEWKAEAARYTAEQGE